jgi:hypothetical protein
MFDKNFLYNTYSTFVVNNFFEKPFELFKYNTSFHFSDELIIFNSNWINDVIVDRFFINILGENLIIDSEKIIVANISPFVKNSKFDVNIFCNRSTITKNLYLNIFKNMPFFTMRNLNKFFWLRSVNMILVNPFVTGSDDFLLSSSQFINWNNHFFRKYNVSFT